jgi:hypothetical protein
VYNHAHTYVVIHKEWQGSDPKSYGPNMQFTDSVLQRLKTTSLSATDTSSILDLPDHTTLVAEQFAQKTVPIEEHVFVWSPF